MTPDLSKIEPNLEEEGINLFHYWNILWRFKFGIIALGLVFAIPTAFIMNGKASIYSSTASILIEESNVNVTSIEDLYGNTQSRNYTSTQFELLRSRNLAERVIRDLNLVKNPDFIPQFNTTENTKKESYWEKYLPESLISLLPFQTQSSNNEPSDKENTIYTDQVTLALALDIFSRSLFISPINNTSIVKIRFSASSPQLAADIANRVASAYIENDMEQRLFATQQASFWLSERVTGLNETLRMSEKNLQDFLDKEQLLDISGVTSLNVQELDELTSQYTNARQIRAEAETIYRQIQSLQNPTTRQLLAFPAILNHPSIQLTKQNADDIEQQIAELSNRYGKNHPKMIALLAEQKTILNNLNIQVSQLQISIESDYQSALKNEESTLERLNLSKSELQSINKKSYELRELERDVATNRQLYDMFFTRIRETQETNDFQKTNAIVVDPAVPAIYPNGPQRKRAVLLALLGGLICGCGLVLLRDLLDNTIKNHTDIENRLHASVLGVVPMIERGRSERKNDNAYLGFLDDMHSRFSESFRTIRTSITLSSLDHPHKILVVTSSVPNEGKTTTAINLASVMGQMSRVLLIDTDLRRPSLNKSITLPPNSPGLSNYLAGNSDLKDCLFNFKKANITVMPAGQIAPNPLELLSSNKFKALLSKLSTNYDHIILDSPPTQAVSDSLVLGSIANAVIFITKAETTPVKLIKNELFRLKKANANVIGVVLNQLDVKKQTAQGYGGYYDSYGYGAPAEEA